jgi:hypothetical protein
VQRIKGGVINRMIKMMKKFKTAILLLAPVVFLLILALGLDERNRVVYGKVEIIPNKRHGQPFGGWNDTAVEMIVDYRPSLLRRLQLVFTKYPDVHPIIGQTYLVDEAGKRYSEFVLPTGRIGMDTWSGWCKWSSCTDEKDKVISADSHPFRQGYRFPFLLRQVPSHVGQVYFHTQFEAYGTPTQEIRILVRK